MMYQLQIINGDMYRIRRKIRIDHDPVINTWKEHLNCDRVFMNKKDGYYYFCELVPEAEIIKEAVT